MREYALAVAFMVALAAPVRAQSVRAMSIDQVERLLAASVGGPQIVSTAGEACIDFEMDDQARARLERAGATVALLDDLSAVCIRKPEPVAETPDTTGASRVVPLQLHDPGSAFRSSLMLPGLGQLRTGRPAMGMVFMGAWSVAVGLAAGAVETQIECLDRVAGSCPDGRIRDTVRSRPYLLPGIAAALGLAVVSAFEARSAAARANRLAGARAESDVVRAPATKTATLSPRIEMAADGAVTLSFRLRMGSR